MVAEIFGICYWLPVSRAILSLLMLLNTFKYEDTFSYSSQLRQHVLLTNACMYLTLLEALKMVARQKYLIGIPFQQSNPYPIDVAKLVLQLNNDDIKCHYAECHCAECHYVECHLC